MAAKPKTSDEPKPMPALLEPELIAINETYSQAVTAIRHLFGALLRAENRLKELGVPVPEAIALYARVYSVHEKIEEVSKHTGALKQTFSRNIVPTAMDDSGTTNMTISEGHRLTRTADKIFASIPTEHRDEAFSWLREHEAGDLIQETVNASTLSAYARTMMEENKELPESLFTVLAVPSVSLTRAKGWRMGE